MTRSCRWSALTDGQLDNLVVASLADTLRTEVGSDEARVVASESATHELMSVLVFAPRLWFFGHRHSLSLRHPRTSFASWAHRIAGGNPRTQSYTTAEVLQEPKALLLDGSPAARRWGVVGNIYQVLLENSPELEEARYRVVHHKAVRDIISRYWKKLVDPDAPEQASPNPPPPPTAATTLLSSSTAAKPSEPSTINSGTTLSDDAAWWRANGSVMTPRQYLYLEIRMSQLLLIDNPLVCTDLLDIFERDMLVDMHRPAKRSLLGSSGDDPVPAFYDPDALEELVGQLANNRVTTDPSLTLEANTGRSDDMYGAMYQEQVWSTARRTRDYRWVGHITFESFAWSLLELADNWTSTTCPQEYAAFLCDIFERLFTQDWSAEADQVLAAAATKRKAPVAGFAGGVPIFVSKSTKSSATSAEKAKHRKQSEAHALAEAEAEGAPVALSSEQIMMLPQDVRQTVLTGTHESIALAEMQYETEETNNVERRKVPVVEVNYVPQLVFDREDEKSGARVFKRGVREFTTIPRMLFTLTAEGDVVSAVEAVRGSVQTSGRQRGQPLVPGSATLPPRREDGACESSRVSESGSSSVISDEAYRKRHHGTQKSQN